MNSRITPLLDSEIAKKARERCIETNDFSSAAWNRFYNEAIREAGFSVKYFKSVMSKFGPEDIEFGPEDVAY